MDAKLNSYIPNWNTPVEPYYCGDSAPAEKVDGDNPSIGVSAELPQQGDQRNYSGSNNSNPVPGKVGA